jgi:hypothetical protein
MMIRPRKFETRPQSVVRAHLVVLTALGIAALSACADGANRAVSPVAPPASVSPSADMSLEEGALYVAELHPLNAMVQQQLDPDRQDPHGVTTGKAYFRVVGGMLHAVVDVTGAEPTEAGNALEGIHPQHIHAASQCPPGSADGDIDGVKDGIVDVIEGLPFYGDILVPLDGNINNGTSEIPTFPFATGARGAYHYEATASVATLSAALGQALNLPARHVVVHGVDLDTPLPASVRSLPGLPAQVTLPVACGEIREVTR